MSWVKAIRARVRSLDPPWRTWPGSLSWKRLSGRINPKFPSILVCEIWFWRKECVAYCETCRLKKYITRKATIEKITDCEFFTSRQIAGFTGIEIAENFCPFSDCESRISHRMRLRAKWICFNARAAKLPWQAPATRILTANDLLFRAYAHSQLETIQLHVGS
jgi:hypothetical protein